MDLRLMWARTSTPPRHNNSRQPSLLLLYHHPDNTVDTVYIYNQCTLKTCFLAKWQPRLSRKKWDKTQHGVRGILRTGSACGRYLAIFLFLLKVTVHVILV